MLQIETINLILSELNSSMSEKSFNYLQLIVQAAHTSELKQFASTVGSMLQDIPEECNKNRQSSTTVSVNTDELLLANEVRKTDKKIKNTRQNSRTKRDPSSFSPIQFTNLSSLKYSSEIVRDGLRKITVGSGSTVKLNSSKSPTVCSKLIYKLQLGKNDEEDIGEISSRASTQSEIDYQFTTSSVSGIDDQGSIYESLIGKIKSSPQTLTEFGSKKSQTKLTNSKSNSVVDLTNKLTNPLYKTYIPQGITKSEDELGKELISSIASKFNKWLGSLEGETKSVQPDALVKILRTELAEPDTLELKKIERCIYSAPIFMVLDLEKKL